MRICFTLFVAFIVFGFYSCTTCSVKKVSCGAFDEPAFFKWFPYEENNTLLFKNTGKPGNTSYVINRKTLSEAYETTTGGFNNHTRDCNSSAEISTFNTGNINEFFSVYYSVSKEFDNGPVTKFLSVYFKGENWPAGEINENSIATPPGQITDSIRLTTSSNVAFDNGITYPYVVTVLKDTVTNKTERVYKLFIAKNSGIIGFEMFPSKEKWIIQ